MFDPNSKINVFLLMTLVAIPFTTSNAANTQRRTGQYSHTTASEYKLFEAGAIGDTDLRLSQQSRPTGALAKKYSAVGSIDCFTPAGNGQYDVYAGTATVVENSSTLITSAHTFVDNNGRMRTDLSNCFFSVRNELGAVVGKPIPVSDLMAPEDLSSKNISTNATAHNDWAVLKLSSPVPNVVPFQVARRHSVNVGDPFRICSFSHDIQTSEQNAADIKIKTCLSGRYRDNGKDTFSKNSQVVFHDISIHGWSSGGPMFTEPNGEPPLIFGLQKGQLSTSLCQYKLPACGNYGILFNQDFYDNLDIIVKETGGSIYAKPTFQK